MTDYRDGNWHLWSGNACPVSLDDLVDCVEHYEHSETASVSRSIKSARVAWGYVVRFRVVKKAPRVWWVNEHGNGLLWIHEDREEALGIALTSIGTRTFKVQEVEE